jgi:hypothetical protein
LVRRYSKLAIYVERIPNRNSPPAILLQESYREGDKIRKRSSPSSMIASFRKSARLITPARDSSSAATRCWPTSALQASPTEQKLRDLQNRRDKKPLRGKHVIGIAVGKRISPLAERATFTRNTMAIAASPDTIFRIYSELTPVQQRAFRLLGVPAKL